MLNAVVSILLFVNVVMISKAKVKDGIEDWSSRELQNFVRKMGVNLPEENFRKESVTVSDLMPPQSSPEIWNALGVPPHKVEKIQRNLAFLLKQEAKVNSITP